MAYNSYTIKDTMEMINQNKIYLPAIQRKFVWKCGQIEKLFDSIMRGYPIGTFLFWSLKEENINKYTFYKFIQNYHERDNYKNEISPRPELKNNIIGVLDGQQRMSSMYIALQGTYAYKKARCSWSNDNAFPMRALCLNLIGNREEDNEYEFKFLTGEEREVINEDELWFEVKEILKWGNDPEIDDYYDELLEKVTEEIKEKITEKKVKSKIKGTLRVLHKRIVQDDLINYFDIQEQELDKILDIFIRVNSAGTVLSKSDLLFSTIVAHWEDGRNEIDSLVARINKKGEGFKIDSDFIMRACLVLSDLPVVFKVEGFKENNIKKIKNNWNNIKVALEKSFDLISEFGFSNENLTSNNAVIPIAYYLNKGLFKKIDKIEIQKYMINVLVKRVYGNHGDQALSHMRESINKIIEEENSFKFKKLAKDFESRSRKELIINKEDLEEIFKYKKGAYSFMILSLLYPNLKYGQVKFHQDHIHPASSFGVGSLKKRGLSEEDIEKWQELKDRIPNLQLLEGNENESKNALPFKEWINREDENGISKIKDIIKYKEDNYIDILEDESIENFINFYEKRNEILKNKFMVLIK